MNTEPFSINSGEYATIFQQFILRTLEALLVASQTEGETLTAVTQQRALRTLDFALNSAHAQGITGKLLVELSPKMEKAGLRDEWIPYIEHWLDSVAAGSDFLRRGELEYQIGFLYQLCSNFEKADHYLSASCDTFSRIGNSTLAARALNRRAYVARFRNQPGEARQYVEQAMVLLKGEQLEREFSYFVLAALAEDAGNYDEAIEYYRSSLDLSKKIGDPHKIALRLGNLGLGLYSAKKYDEAVSCYAESISIFSKLGDVFRVASMKLNLGNVYLLSEKPVLALTLFTEVEKTYRKMQDIQHLALVYLNLGITQRMLGNLEQSQNMLQTSIQYWLQLSAIAPLINALDELGLTYSALNHYEQATHVFTDAISKLAEQPQISEYTRLKDRITAHLENAKLALSA